MPLKDSEHQRRYYLKNIEHIRARKKAHYHIPEVNARIRARVRAYRLKHKKRISEYQKRPEIRARRRVIERQYRANPEARTKYLIRLKRWKDNLKNKVFEAYGNQCSCCGETRETFLTIDHIRGDGKEHRKRFKQQNHALYNDIIKQGFPRDKYQVLCMNCNWGTRYGDPCPHELERKEIAGIREREL